MFLSPGVKAETSVMGCTGTDNREQGPVSMGSHTFLFQVSWGPPVSACEGPPRLPHRTRRRRMLAHFLPPSPTPDTLHAEATPGDLIPPTMCAQASRSLLQDTPSKELSWAGPSMPVPDAPAEREGTADNSLT